MSELVQCTACSQGYIEVPKMEYDSKGEPIVIVHVSTCTVCHGNGMVER